MDLQELITRGRFIFSKAPERLRLFELVNGRRNTPELAKMTRRLSNNIHRDLQILFNSGLIQAKTDKSGGSRKVNGFLVFEKVPLARTIPTAYFRGPSKVLSAPSRTGAAAHSSKPNKVKRPAPMSLPTETELLDICKDGEDQLFEFKGQGTETRKIAREIAAMLHTRQGGFIFYGVDDAGTIQGSDMTRQKLDQALQNSV